MKEARFDESLWFNHKDGYRLYPWYRNSKKRGRSAYWVSDGSNLIEDADPVESVEDLIREVFGRMRSVWLCPSSAKETGGLYRLGERSIRDWDGTAAVKSLVAAALSDAGEVAIDIPENQSADLKRSVSPEVLIATMDAEVSRLSATERVALVKQRIGQSIFRDALLEHWEGRCAVSALDMPDLLRASHAKPWARCANEHEQLDPFNGLLLSPQLDLLFDRGYVTFDERGQAIWSRAISLEVRDALGLASTHLKMRWITEKHLPYLDYHRVHVFRDATQAAGDGAHQSQESALA